MSDATIHELRTTLLELIADHNLVLGGLLRAFEEPSEITEKVIDKPEHDQIVDGNVVRLRTKITHYLWFLAHFDEYGELVYAALEDARTGERVLVPLPS